MFVSPLPLLKTAKKRRYALGAFNFNNMESLQAIVSAAEATRSPVIVATSEGCLAYAGIDYVMSLATVAATQARVPVVLHLDHGRNLETIKQCIQRGYTSVMYDGSHLPLKDNIKQTKKVVHMAHKSGVAVEGELGTIGGAEDAIRARKILYTEPEEAKRFVDQTGVDSLAVAIGTSHGAYKFASEPKLDIKRLKSISLTVGVPLVLHGASVVPQDLVRKAKRFGAQLKGAKGVPLPQVKQAVRNGITKVNVDTDLRLSFTEAVREVAKQKPYEIDPRVYLGQARKVIQSTVEARMRALGSKGMA